MADQLQFPQGSFAGGFNLDPLGHAQAYVENDPYAIRPFNIVSQAVQGYLSGFSTLPIGEMPTNRIEQVSRQLGHLGGFVGFLFPKGAIRSAGRAALAKNGMSAAAAGVANFRSIPMLAADIVTKKINSTNAAKSALRYLDNSGRLPMRQFIQEGLHLGIASGVGAWTEGFQASLMAGVQGAVLGAGTAGISNLPLLRERDLTSNVLRSMAGGVIDAVPTYYMGGDTLDIAYSAALGAIFGYRQPNAAMARAQEFYYRDMDPIRRGDKGLLHDPESGFAELPKEAQAEVERLMETDKTREVGASLRWIAEQFGMKDERTPEQRAKDDAREELDSAIMLRRKYHYQSDAGRSLVDFAERHRQGNWDSYEVASLVESAGNWARANDASFEQFQETVSNRMKSAGLKLEDGAATELQDFYLQRVQTEEIPTMGFDSQRGLVQFREGQRDFDGKRVSILETMNLVNFVQRQMGVLGPDDPITAGHMVINATRRATETGVRTGQVHDMDPDMLLDFNNLTRAMPEKTMTVTDRKNGESQVSLVDEDGRPNFYIAHAENDKSKLHALRYNYGDDLDATWKELTSSLNTEQADALRLLEQDFVERGARAGGRLADADEARLEFKKQYASNVRYWQGMNTNVPLERLLSGDGFLDNVAAFNKRLQPLFNNYYRVPSNGPEDGLKYLIVDDLADYAFLPTGENGKQSIGAEISDGAVLLSDAAFDRLIQWTHLKNKDDSSLKPFVLHDDGENGLLIGKMAFHRADPRTQQAMDAAGVQALFHRSAVKQQGERISTRYRLGGDTLEIFDGAGFRAATAEDALTLPFDRINLDLHKGGSDKQYARVLKQMATATAREQMAYSLETGDSYSDFGSADVRERALYDKIMHRGLVGVPQETALHDYLANPSDEAATNLINNIDRVNKIELFNAVYQRGNEKLRDTINKYLMGRIKSGDLDPEDGVNRFDGDDPRRTEQLRMEMDSSEQPTRVLMRMLAEQGGSTNALAFSSVGRRSFEKLYANWIITEMTRPIDRFGFKAVMKPVTGGIARLIKYDGQTIRFGDDDTHTVPDDAPNLTDRSFLLESGLKSKRIPSTLRIEDEKGVRLVQEVRSLEEIWNDFRTTSDESYRAALGKDLTGILARAPLGDISGAQDLQFGGFVDTRGTGVILHEKTMRRLGGADLDIDDAFVFYGLPDFMRQMVGANRNNQDRFNELIPTVGDSKVPGRVQEFLRSDTDLMALSQDASKGLRAMAMFDPTHRIALGQAVAKSRSEATGQAVNNRLFIHTMYSHAVRNGGVLEEAIGKSGYRIRYTARNDNGELLRARSDGAVQASVDVANYGKMVDPAGMAAIQMDAAFSRIEVVNAEGKRVTLLKNDQSMTRNERGERVFATITDDQGQPRGNLWEAFTSNGKIRAGKDGPEFRLSDTLLSKLRMTNAVLQDTRFSLEQRQEMLKAFPRDANGDPLTGYLYESAKRVMMLKPEMTSVLDYVFAPESNFTTRYREIASYINGSNQENIRETHPFFFVGDHRAVLPTKKFLQRINALHRYYSDKRGGINMRTIEGRRMLAASQSAYTKLHGELSRVGDGVKIADPSAPFSDRIQSLEKLHSDVERFVTHDMDEIVGFPLMRQIYLKSTLKPEEAAEILDLATFMKSTFADIYRTDKMAMRGEYDALKITMRKASANKHASDVFKGMYFDFVGGNRRQSGNRLMSDGIDEFVRRANMDEDRMSGAAPKITRQSVMEFLDASILSAHGIQKVKGAEGPDADPVAAEVHEVLRTASRTIGFEVASQGVMKEWVSQYNDLFGNLMSGQRADAAKTIVEGTSVASREGRMTHNAHRKMVGIVWPEGNVQDKEVKAVAESVARLASTYEVFREDPNNIVYLMRHMTGKAQPEDMTIDDLRGLERQLKQWKTGGFFLSWLTRKGGFKTMEDMQKWASDDNKKFQWWHTLGFIRSNSDATKIGDLRLIDEAKHQGGRLLRTAEKLPDGTYKTNYVSAQTKAPESAFDRLIDLNGQMLESMANSNYNRILERFGNIASFLKGGVVGRINRIDDQDEIHDIAVFERELAGRVKAMRTERSGEKLRLASRDIDLFRERKTRALLALAKKHGINTDRKINEIEKELSDREYVVQMDGKEQIVTMRQAMDHIVRQYDVFDDVYRDHILGESWIEKYLRPHIGRDGEIDMKAWANSMESLLRRGLPEHPDQHVPLDVGRLFNIENEIRVEANRLLTNREINLPRDLAAVQRLDHAPQAGARLARRALDLADIRTVTDAQAVAEEVRAFVRRNDDMPFEQRRALERFADYLFKPLDARDYRRVWQKETSYSQFAEDMHMASNFNEKTAHTYTRRKLRDESWLQSTEYVDGAFPHLGHDRELLLADGEKRVRSVTEVSAAESIRDDMDGMLLRPTDFTDQGDAFAEYMLTDDTGKFFESFRTETFGNAIDRRRNWDGYRTDSQVVNEYARRLSTGAYQNIVHALSRNVIRDFEARAPMGEHTPSWATWMRLYVRDASGKPSVFTPEIMDQLKLTRTPYYWLSDHAGITKGTGLNRALVRMTGAHRINNVDRAVFEQQAERPMTLEEEKQFEANNMKALTTVQDGDNIPLNQAKALSRMYKGLSDLEAKYEMMALLFHAKAYTANVIGGTVNTVAHTGLRNWRKASDLTFWQGINPEFKSMDDVNQWVAKLGVIEDYIVHEAAITGRYRSGRMKQFLDEAVAEIRQNPNLANRRLYEIAKKNGITEKAVDTAAFFMRDSERRLRTRSFLAAYSQARESLAPMADLPYDHSMLIDLARKGVATSQFLYGASERPAFARTNFGKMYSRFKLWGWASPKMRRTIYQDAATHGFQIGSPEFSRLQRIAQADMMAMSLMAMFPFSIFEFTLPPPFSWFQDLSDYFFGDEFDKDMAFFGSPLGPLNELMPVTLSKFVNVGEDVFRGIVSGEMDTMATYHISTLFPFGRMGYDVARSLSNPLHAPRYLAGIPLREFAGAREKIIRERTYSEVSPIMEQAFQQGDMTERQMIEYFESQGRTDTEARMALRESLDRGSVSRSMQRTANGRAYVYRFDGEGAQRLPGAFTEGGGARGF